MNNIIRTIKQATLARQNGPNNYDCMAEVAINSDINPLRILFDWAMEDGVETITVPAWTKSFSDYISSNVLTYVWANYSSRCDKDEEWCKEAEALTNHFRSHVPINYNPIIGYVISEGFNKNEKRLKITFEKLLKMADEDTESGNFVDFDGNFEIDFQTHLSHALGRIRYCHEYLRSEGQKRDYKFNWQKMADKLSDIRQIVKWAIEDNQEVTVDCQRYAEAVYRDSGLVSYYAEMAKKLDQNFDWTRLVDLSGNLQTLVPDGYDAPKYPNSLTINLQKRGTDQGHDFGNDLLVDLYRYAMMTTEIVLIEYEGKRYYQRSNMWGEGSSEGLSERPLYDPDVNCEFYTWDGECEAPSTIFPDNPDEVTYHLSYDQDGIDWNDEQINHNNLIRLIKHIDPSQITLVGYETLILENDNGINDDHRGSNHCQVDLEFYDEYKMKLPISLMDFMKGCYRIKSHKWDKWYELYCGGTVDMESKSITLTTSFDHGS